MQSQPLSACAVEICAAGNSTVGIFGTTVIRHIRLVLMLWSAVKINALGFGNNDEDYVRLNMFVAEQRRVYG